MPPISPSPPVGRRATAGRAVGRSLDLLGVAVAGVLIVSPPLAFFWICARLLHVPGEGTPRGLTAAISAVAVLSGWILFRVTAINLRSIRNARKPPELTWRQFAISQRFLHRAAVAIIAVGVVGVAVAIPAHV